MSLYTKVLQWCLIHVFAVTLPKTGFALQTSQVRGSHTSRKYFWIADLSELIITDRENL